MKRVLVFFAVLFALVIFTQESKAQKVFTLQAKRLQVDDSCNIGTVTSIGGANGFGINTEGFFGVPPVCDTIRAAALVASVAATNFVNVASPGFYMVIWSINVLTTDAGAPTLSFTFAWNNGSAQTTTTSTVSAAAASNQANGVVAMLVASGTPTWVNTVGGTIGTASFRTNAALIRLF